LRVISQEPFVYEQHSYTVTISAGVATTLGEKSVAPIDLIKTADENLFKAKREGRNRVCS
jgi:diguanylate cyclase (GGDEF)-like protein